MQLQSYAAGQWRSGTGSGAVLRDATTGEVIAHASADGLETRSMLAWARDVGGPNLRRLTFHERAALLKALARDLSEHKDEYYPVSFATGATRGDSWIDIDGGISTLFVYASKGTRELPNSTVYVDGGVEALSKAGTFVGQHLCVPLEGAAVHINAFNFPVWGMLEKLAPTLLAGVPAIVKPATQTSYLTERVFRRILESGILPEGAVQLDLRRGRRPVRAPYLPGRRLVHGLGRHRAPAAPAPGRHGQLGALHRGDRFSQLLDPRARCRRRARPSSISSSARWCAR